MTATDLVQVRYFAVARARVGVAEEWLPGALGLAGIVAAVTERTPEASATLAGCSFLVNGLRTFPTDEPLVAGAVVDVLPPFAGG
ncbi:MAG: MoaD/ThiS family protein [Propionibacteriaceae bacterium]|jgi:molybdopterin converting factor small subunit|nr:MoaD/ThiS family protein [Propionibacteriaceae bacterium]